MVYITVRQSPMYHQMTLEELLFQDYTGHMLVTNNETNTRTYEMEYASEHFTSRVDVFGLIRVLKRFNESTEYLREASRESLYRSFSIPKKSGGLRRINAPKPELMNALRNLKVIFEEKFHALYHTSAFAYIQGRSTIHAVKRHQMNESKWFAKLDLSDFFGSTTLDFVMQQFGMVFPFSEVVKNDEGRAELYKALELAFLNGGLPQGTPISPIITNIMMIPIDFKLSKAFRDFNKQHFVNTRYADDFIISSKYNFDVKSVEQLIVDTLAEFNAPFSINKKKTRYGSSAGSNWNLGIMLNKDNEMTVGYKNKRRFQTMMHNYIMDKQNGVSWSIGDVRTLKGTYDYYHMIEGETIDAIVSHINEKKKVNVMQMISRDLRFA